MFGLEILDVILGLAFVYLLLSMICSAVHEYVAGALIAVMVATGQTLESAAQRRASRDLRALLEHAVLPGVAPPVHGMPLRHGEREQLRIGSARRPGEQGLEQRADRVGPQLQR